MAVGLRFAAAAEDLRRLARLELLRRFARGRPRTGQSHSIHFDTAELALRNRGIALHLRRVDGAWVQTVAEERKGGGRAREYEWPVPEQTFDLSLAKTTPFARVFAKKRIRRGLVPIFSARSRRTAWLLDLGEGCAAELYLNAGEMVAGTRRERIGEMNIEPITGDALRPYELALALMDAVPLRLEHRSIAERGYALFLGKPEAPRKAVRPVLSPQMAPVEALQRIAAICISQVQANEAGFLRGRDPEYLHQLRVGWRRLRSTLSMPRDPFWKEALDPLRPELRWLSRSLSAARNWDVFAIEILPRLVRDLSPSANPERSRELALLRLRCNRMRKRYGDIARDAIRSDRYHRLLLRLGRLLAVSASSFAESPPGTPGGSVRDFAASALKRRDRRLRKIGRQVLAASAADRHQVRIAAKKLRYASEFFIPLFGKKSAERYAARLADLQDVLGALNDAVNAAEMVAEAVHSGKTPFPENIGELAAAWFAADEEEKLPKLGKAWKRFSTQRPFWTRE